MVESRDRASGRALQPPDRARGRALGGIKSLYSESYFSRAEFDAAYGAAAYAALKARYDPQHRLLDLYEKCVRGG